MVAEPSAQENGALAAALRQYSKRKGPDDFSSLTGFVEKHPNSAWNAALLSGLGTEYYNTAHYSKALEAWRKGWELGKTATEPRAKAMADRAAGELAYMLARLGRMEELEALLKSVEGRTFIGSATEKIAGAREGLWNMQHRPEISFRCGPLALHRIKAVTGASTEADMAIHNSASTQRGTSLPQVAELSKKIGLNYQMTFREKGAPFIVPSVIHWKVGHYAALTKQEGHRYFLQDPTFGNDVWATTNALESEASGYFLIPSGPLPTGWRAVEPQEAEKIWGKGNISGHTPHNTAPGDPASNPCDSKGKRMAVSRVHLMLVNLNLIDAPVGYAPPVGPAIEFTVRYNHREAFQPSTFTYANFGPKWTCDWVSYITDNPQSPSADVNYYVRGGGTRIFNGFNTNSQRFAPQSREQSRLTRTGAESYEMVSPDGSKMIFSRSDGSAGTSRKIFLTQVTDPFGNTVTLNYDASLRLTNIVDAIGQATTLSYSNASDIYKITRVTDPFGRVAEFQYDSLGRLTNITDVIGINSRFNYEGSGDFINTLITPYGTTSFTRGDAGTTRWLETLHPDGSKERVEFNQGSNLGVPFSEPAAQVPRGMGTFNQWLYARNTYYWSRTACAQAYGDYTKAKIYHWLHELDLSMASGVLESIKEPLEGRVWFDYPGQASSLSVGTSDKPRHIGRVLDDSSTQLYSYEYNEFGHVTNSVDPVGRTFSSIYSTNGIDLLEVRMTRAGKNELLYSATYNDQHLPLAMTDAAGQTTTNTYNARGQLLTTTNPKGETTTYTYDTNGYLVAIDGPLPGTNDTLTATYDSFGRTRTKTDESGYTIVMSYDALDRITNITFPDATFHQFTYNRLDPSAIQDRAGRQTLLEHNSMRDLVKRTDPLNRVTRFEWCRCGNIKSLTDPMGRTTQWHTDVQGRLTAKEYGDGSKVSYFYENASGRLRQVVDEKLQIKQFSYHRDNALRSIHYLNAFVPTPAVTFSYDPDYSRRDSMTDGMGTTHYNYAPITAVPTLGAGQLLSIDGPLPNDTVTYQYDELGRQVLTAIDGVASLMTHDQAGRLVSETNALGTFTNVYDAASARLLLQTFPNGQRVERGYAGNLQDRALQRITHMTGATPISEFLYDRDIARRRINTWSQQTGASPPGLYAAAYDDAGQLLSVSVTNSGNLLNQFAYTYDPVGNRLSEQVGNSNYAATYNALNQISTTTAPGNSRTNEWDAEGRLAAVTAGPLRTEFAYDGLGRLISLRQLTNGSEISFRRFVWCDDEICQERDASGTVTKRFFAQGVKVETGTNAGNFFYTRDHLGSIRELLDSAGNVRARYAYDPYGRRTRLTGDLEADFGFTGLFQVNETGLSLARFRIFDANLGRWLSRDPLRQAEQKEGPNLYTYVGNDPLNKTDPLGLQAEECCESEKRQLRLARVWCGVELKYAAALCEQALKENPDTGMQTCAKEYKIAKIVCDFYEARAIPAYEAALAACLQKCGQDPKCNFGLPGTPPTPPAPLPPPPPRRKRSGPPVPYDRYR